MAEIAFLLLLAVGVLWLGWSIEGSGLLVRRTVVRFANVLIFVMVWGGLRLPGQGWMHLGLSFRFGGLRRVFFTVLQSIVVFVAALATLMAVPAVMMQVQPRPQGTDVAGYEYLHGNLPMLLIALAASMWFLRLERTASTVVSWSIDWPSLEAGRKPHGFWQLSRVLSFSGLTTLGEES